MSAERQPEYMTVEEASAYLGVTPGAVRRLLRQHGLGELLRASLNKQVRIRKQDLDALAASLGSTRSGESGRTSRNRRRGAA